MLHYTGPDFCSYVCYDADVAMLPKTLTARLNTHIQSVYVRTNILKHPHNIRTHARFRSLAPQNSFFLVKITFEKFTNKIHFSYSHSKAIASLKFEKIKM